MISPKSLGPRKLHPTNSHGSLFSADDISDVDPFMQPIHMINMRRAWGLQELNSFISVIKGSRSLNFDDMNKYLF